MFNADKSADDVGPPAAVTASTTRAVAGTLYTPGATTAPMTCTVMSTAPSGDNIDVAENVAATFALVAAGEVAPAKGSEFSSGGAGARNNHHAPMHTTTTDPVVANALAGPYQSSAARTRDRNCVTNE